MIAIMILYTALPRKISDSALDNRYSHQPMPELFKATSATSSSTKIMTN